MGQKKQHQRAGADTGDSQANAARPSSVHGPIGRPRLGSPTDSWATVLKDVVREAPKTALLVLSGLLVSVASLIAYLVAVFTGLDVAAPPDYPTIKHLIRVALEVTRRVMTEGR